MVVIFAIFSEGLCFSDSEKLWKKSSENISKFTTEIYSYAKTNEIHSYRNYACLSKKHPSVCVICIEILEILIIIPLIRM